jgi:hypothetical protein
MRVLLLLLYAFAVPYLYVQATAEVSTSPVSHFVTMRIHLPKMGDTATACVVKAGPVDPHHHVKRKHHIGHRQMLRHRALERRHRFGIRSVSHGYRFRLLAHDYQVPSKHCGSLP